MDQCQTHTQLVPCAGPFTYVCKRIMHNEGQLLGCSDNLSDITVADVNTHVQRISQFNTTVTTQLLSCRFLAATVKILSDPICALPCQGFLLLMLKPEGTSSLHWSCHECPDFIVTKSFFWQGTHVQREGCSVEYSRSNSKLRMSAGKT